MPACREVLSLDGDWSLQLPDGSSRTVRVPGSWTAQVDGYGDSHDTVRYERTFDWQPTVEAERRQVLRFDAVNQTARVWLNGIFLGAHEGAWLPFEFDATEALAAGRNRVEVEVAYPPRLGTDEQPGFLEHPIGKQSWYGTTAGIWQSVQLEDRPAAHLTDLQVVADAETGRIRVRVGVNPAGAALPAVAVVRDGDRIIDTVELTPAEAGARTGELAVADPHLWDPDDPFQYLVEVHLADADALQLHTGFRHFRAEGGSFWLNGREIYLRAVLDQDYHPGAQPAPDDLDEWEHQLRETRDLGFNMLRVHIKRPDPRYYELADRLGLLVWTELPCGMIWTPEAAERGRQLLRSLIATDSHHPSIVMWTIINESWGIDLDSPAQRAWLRAMYDEVSALTPGCLVVDNSPCEPNYHLRSDVDDFHVYRGIPESRRDWDAKIADFATRPDWTYSPHGDAERTGTEPLVLSEFGNWGLPQTLDQYTDGAEPWWFALGADWAFGAADGTGLLQRYQRLGLERVFSSWDGLIDQLQRAQFVSNAYQTTSIRLQTEIRGYVLTQLSDVLWEANGLFDAHRRPKKLTGEFALVNGEHAVALRPSAYSGFAGDQVDAAVTVLPGPSGLDGAVLRLTLDGHLADLADGEPAERPIPSTAGRHWQWTGRAGAAPVVRLPEQPGEYRLVAELVVDGRVVAADAADLCVVARSQWTGGPVIAGDAEVAAWLSALGVASEPLEGNTASAGALVVVRQFDAAARQLAAAGGRVLVLVEDGDAFGDAFTFLPVRLGPRTGDGDWVPRVEWLDRTGSFAALPGGPVLGIAFEDLLGDLVMNGLPSPLRDARVHSGLFSGWLRGAAATTATLRWSEGTMTATTLKVRHGAGLPVGHAVGHALLNAASAG